MDPESNQTEEQEQESPPALISLEELPRLPMREGVVLPPTPEGYNYDIPKRMLRLEE